MTNQVVSSIKTTTTADIVSSGCPHRAAFFLTEPATTLSKPLVCDMEVSVPVGERRVFARAHLRETAPGIFSLTPFHLREVNGSLLAWSKPLPGEPIEFGWFDITFDDARFVPVL